MKMLPAGQKPLVICDIFRRNTERWQKYKKKEHVPQFLLKNR